MNELLNLGSAALKAAATDSRAKAYLLTNPLLYRVVWKAAQRYVAGDTLAQALVKVRETQAGGMKSSLEYIGENAGSEKEAALATREFQHICGHIGAEGLHTTVSLDLSHIGLNQSAELCLNNLLAICRQAERYGIEVNLSAEGTGQTDKIISLYQEAAKLTGVLAVTLQAYLYRTRDDFDELKNLPGRIRIVKGAYATAPGLSMARGEALNDAYLDYIAELLETQHKCSIATHDYQLQQEAKNLVNFYRPLTTHYEFESLYGICQQQLLDLHEEGYSTKLYYVYGQEWYLYLCNRLAEYPMNLFRALADICETETA
ncbi:proline dehydrogenase family protein [Pedobacter sp. SYP-B3415]|uniref:proline dehydrogenase family protein n=1 Tax=Pedobacter sp. SYP-B3415 TaxID=2496641 RepID=UPI00101C0AE4|nr:proline dehydrogenase family protein [Pedobacter sp. SYP-B3415]